MPRFSIELLATDRTTSARRGRLNTAHGPVDTPVFMPVGTRATVKGMPTPMLDELGAQIVLANAYREKFGGDHIDDVRAALAAYEERIGWKRRRP
jgi:tRNA-guanine family transglycosylase